MSGWFRTLRPDHWAARSLQRQFMAITMVLILISSVAFLGLVIQQYRASILATQSMASKNVNLLLQAALENAMIKRDLDGLQDIVVRLGTQQGVAGVMIANPEGVVRFSSYPDMLDQSLSDPQFHSARDSGALHSGIRTLASGQEVLRSINPVHNQPQCLECHGPVADHPVNGLLIVDYDSSNVRQVAFRGALMLALLGLVVLLLLEVGLWAALRRLVLRRIEALSRSTTKIAAGALSERVGAEGADELADLACNFDNMATQLEAKVDELHASKDLLQALIDAVPDGVRVIGPDFRIVAANRAYAAQIGAGPDQVVGALCYCSSHRRNAPCVPTLVRCPVVEILQGTQGDLKCNHVHLNSEGTELSVEVSAAPVTMQVDGQSVRCVVESIRDLEADVSISHRQRLSEMGILAAGVAHEVHNPLSSISLALRAIRSQPGLATDTSRYVDIAEKEIASCLKITGSLLRLSAAPSEQVELVEIGTAIEDTLSLLKHEMDQRNVVVERDIQQNPRVLAKDSDIRNLVFNLALNAIHAMPDGGTLSVHLQRGDGLIRIDIADTGVGISERDKGKILLPFWTRRADGSRGRGLGLAICSSVVKALGGTLSFESQLGVGTRFVVTLKDTEERPS